MPHAAHDEYLGVEVRTAPPQKLHLMLIEAALRSAERARQHWQAGQNEPAIKALVHAQAALGRMLADLDHESGEPLVRRVAAEYEFIFRTLVRAGLKRDEKCLADAIRILQIEARDVAAAVRQAGD